MSSRQEKKQRRREERVARERAEARREAAQRRFRWAAGGAIALFAAAAIVVAVLAAGGGSKEGGAGSGPSAAAKAVTLPAVRISDLDRAAKAAGCVVKSYPSEGQTHMTSDTATFKDYKTNPPTSGTHRVAAADDGIYRPGDSPATENAVHALEHGRINVQYKPGLPARREAQLEALVTEDFRGVAGYHQLLFENQTGMPYPVAAAAWTQLLGCRTMNDRTFDAIRAFRQRYVDKAPELIP